MTTRRDFLKLGAAAGMLALVPRGVMSLASRGPVGMQPRAFRLGQPWGYIRDPRGHVFYNMDTLISGRVSVMVWANDGLGRLDYWHRVLFGQVTMIRNVFDDAEAEQWIERCLEAFSTLPVVQPRYPPTITIAPDGSRVAIDFPHVPSPDDRYRPHPMTRRYEFVVG